MTNDQPSTGRSPYAARRHDHHNPLAGGKVVPTEALAASGDASSKTFLRGDNSWAEPPVAPVAAPVADVDHDIPVGGTTGQVLAKVSATDYDVDWENRSTFDPNENPVIIGETATAGGGSTPSNVSAGTLHVVAIGHAASASGTAGIAIGRAANAQASAQAVAIGRSSSSGGDNDVCIGSGSKSGAWGGSVAIGYLADAATASTNGGTTAIAIGASATAANNDGIAIGDQAVACTDNLTDVAAVAIGKLASATKVNSVALGASASASVANQIMLGGADTHFVEVCRHDTVNGSILVMKSPNGTRYALQVSDTGVFSVIASPV